MRLQLAYILFNTVTHYALLEGKSYENLFQLCKRRDMELTRPNLHHRNGSEKPPNKFKNISAVPPQYTKYCVSKTLVIHAQSDQVASTEAS